MIGAEGMKDLHDDFEPTKDALFFKVGGRGVISFHGKNYNIAKRMSAEQVVTLTHTSSFLRISGNCYVNVDKISAVDKDQILFGDPTDGVKQLPIPWRKQQFVMARLTERHSTRLVQ